MDTKTVWNSLGPLVTPPAHCSSEVSGGAITYTGILKVRDTKFEANQAVKEGFAVMSLGVLEEGAFSNVYFANNVPHCPAGQYGYDQAVDNSVRHGCLRRAQGTLTNTVIRRLLLFRGRGTCGLQRRSMFG